MNDKRHEAQAYGLLVLLVALPAIVVLCLLHNRIREEEADEEYLRTEQTAAP